MFRRAVPIASALAAAALAADDPPLHVANWVPRVGDTCEFSLPARPAEQARLVVRSRGEQEIVAAVAATGQLRWRVTPRHPGACIIAIVTEPTDPAHAAEDAASDDRSRRPPAASQPAAPREHRYRKLFLSVQPPADPDARRPVEANAPSGSACARFGHRFEMTPLVDPTCVSIGADLPMRVKFEGADLADAAVVVRTESDGTGSTIRANKSGLVNLRIDRPGVWNISCTHEVGNDRFIAAMTFRVSPPLPPVGDTP